MRSAASRTRNDAKHCDAETRVVAAELISCRSELRKQSQHTPHIYSAE